MWLGLRGTSPWQIKPLGQRNTEAVLEKVGYLGVHLQEREQNAWDFNQRRPGGPS